jgi:tetratricopeptide (TPR) repeat protein
VSEEATRRDLLREAVRGLASEAPVGSCLGEEELMLFYSGGLPEARMDAIRDHLVACAACRSLAGEAREFLELRTAPTPARLWHLLPRLAKLAAALVLAAAGGWAVWAALRGPSPPAGGQWKDLAIARAEYAELDFRGEAPAPPPGSPPTFVEAMKPYTRGDDSAAEAALARYLAARPEDHEAHFYRGVSLLLLGRRDEAVAELETARRSDEEWVRDEGAWYLALARLRGGDAPAAAAALDELLARGKRRQDDARRLREEIRRATGG